MHIDNFYTYSRYKSAYCTHDREPFYEIALKYCKLTKKEKPVVADIGSGEGDFYHFVRGNNFSADNVYLLDANEKTVEDNKRLTPHSVLYMAPERLPFADGSVDVIHASHLMGILKPREIYALMLEMNRVLANGGYLVMSSPLWWNDFYNDLSHVRPYNPRVFHKYFVEMYRNPRLQKVSNDYEMVELIYRYHQFPLDEGWGSTIPAVDYLIITFKRVLNNLKIRKLYKNGYTMVLKKGA